MQNVFLQRTAHIIVSIASAVSSLLATWVLYISAGRLDAIDGSLTRDSMSVRLLAWIYLVVGAWIGSRSWWMTLATQLPVVGTPLMLFYFFRVPARLRSLQETGKAVSAPREADGTETATEANHPRPIPRSSLPQHDPPDPQLYYR